MTTVAFTSTTGTGLLQSDWNQIVQMLQTSGVEAVNLRLVTPTTSTGSVVTIDATQTLTNKTYDTAGAGNALSIASIAVTANTGTGAIVRAGTPTITNPALSNSNITGIKQATFNGVVDNGNSGTGKNIDWTTGLMQKITLTANTTLTYTAPSATARMTLLVIQDGTGSRTVTWPTTKWAGSGAPTLTTTASRTDIVTTVYDGSTYYSAISLNFN